MLECTFASERLTLRPLRLQDVDVMFSYRSNPRVYQYQCWEPKTAEEIETFIASLSDRDPDTPGKWFQFGIEEKDTGKLIGDTGFRTTQSDSRQAEVGITLSPDFQGHGYATEGLRAILDYLFIELKKHRVFGSVDPRNAASIALMQRIGMRKEAHHIQSLWFKGAWADDLIYAVLLGEWTSLRKSKD